MPKTLIFGNYSWLAWGALALLALFQAPLKARAANAEAPLKRVGTLTMKEARYSSAALIFGQRLYVFGGRSSEYEHLDSIESLDLESGEGRPEGRLENHYTYCDAVLLGTKAYVLRGVGPVEVIDLGKGSRKSIPNPTRPRGFFGCVAIDEEVFILGGRCIHKDKVVWTNAVDVLNTRTGQWRSGSPMLTPRETMAVVVNGPFILAVGGANGDVSLANVEAMNPKTGGWSSLPLLCEPVFGHSVAFVSPRLYIFGDSIEASRTLVYNLKTKTSRVFRTQYTPVRHSRCVVHGNRIYVVGGYDPMKKTALKEIQVFEVQDTE